ncbi:MAG: PKD domain-containing protein [Rhodothermales bacterium]|nr:PKD domain-containing protein [Rhodothermales bacterium]
MALLLFASAAEAQVVRPYNTPYIEARVGLALYGGDIDGAPDNDVGDYLDNGGIGAAGEIGYQFSSSFGFGVSFNYGNYPAINDFNSEFVESRSQIQALFRYFLFPSSRITPYVKFGAGYSFEPDFGEDSDQQPGPADASTEPGDGWGPVAGLGVDLLLGKQFSLFIEGTAAYYFPDNAIDGFNPEDEEDNADFDWLSLIGGGARFWFRAPITEVDAQIDCPTSLETGQAGTFTAFVNEDATGPLTYTWEYGDGQTADGLVSTHAYDSAGTYTVTFTATGPGNSDTETCLVTVTEPPPPEVAPVLASCVANPSLVGIGEPVQFSANLVEGTRPVTFSYDFGDGATADQLNVSHVYNEVGTYTATLTATNEFGSDTCEFEITVIDRFCDEVTELNTVFFDRSMSTLDEEDEDRLAENVAVLERCDNICVVINGYADSRERNPLRLSERRAAAVQAYYLQSGIGDDRSVARGLGVAPDCDYKEDRGASCRRAESIPVSCDELGDYEEDMDDMDDDDDGM